MFKTFLRKISPNPLDRIVKKAQKKGQKRFLLGWNRGLGDIALGLFAICKRIQEKIPDAEITFLIRKNLEEGFSLLQGVNVLVAPDWKRGESYNIEETLKKLSIEKEAFEVILEKPNPTYWVKWQLGKVTPKLSWKKELDCLCKSFAIPEGKTIVGVQANAETAYGYWRNWPEKNWQELFSKREEDLFFVLFGFEKTPLFSQKNVLDLRGKTTLFEAISIIKNRCQYLIVPDSGLLSMTYYLEEAFPIKVLSLWADPNHGILKQNVASPNPLLKHIPLIGNYRDLSPITVEKLSSYLGLGTLA